MTPIGLVIAHMNTVEMLRRWAAEMYPEKTAEELTAFVRWAMYRI